MEHISKMIFKKKVFLKSIKLYNYSRKTSHNIITGWGGWQALLTCDWVSATKALWLRLKKDCNFDKGY